MTMGKVITGPQFRAVRARSHLTNKQLASMLDVSPSTISNWLRDGVVGKSEADVEDKLGMYLLRNETGARPLDSMSSAALIAQMQQIIGILAARLEDSLPKGEAGSGFGQRPSEGGGEAADKPTVRPGPTGAAIRGHLGMPPQV
jgi:DNA-binding XRE family transcriptional regulator